MVRSLMRHRVSAIKHPFDGFLKAAELNPVFAADLLFYLQNRLRREVFCAMNFEFFSSLSV